MTIWDAHKDLALALGDSISIPGAGIPLVTIPDGIRFLKEHRDNALYRAMLTVLRNAVRSASAMEKKIASVFLMRMFPNLQKTDTLACNGASSPGDYKLYDVDFSSTDKPCYIFSILESITTVPIPIKDHITYTGMLNTRISERSDAFATTYEGNMSGSYRLNIWVPTSRTDPSVYEITPLTVRVHYLRYPVHPKDAEITDELEIEELWYQHILSLAMQYCLIDSQEIENVAQLIQSETIDQMPKIGGQNAS
jgi:hypothetical protein